MHVESLESHVRSLKLHVEASAIQVRVWKLHEENIGSRFLSKVEIGFSLWIDAKLVKASSESGYF